MKQIIGIVGCEARRFSPEAEVEARRAIRALLLQAKCVVSGACHKGGVDEWAVDEANKKGVETQVFPARVHQWAPAGGYRERNARIAEASELVVCIAARRHPPVSEHDYCYHCNRDDHVKSGGCWVLKFAKKLGKQTQLIIVP
jgi:hypothetical protein